MKHTDTYLNSGNPLHCTGCGGCVQACPVGCITLTPGEDGFLFPTVDTAACLSCGRCVAVCPCAHTPEAYSPLTALAAVNTRDAVITASSSGGVFTALAEEILRRGGAVCGAAWQEDFRCAQQWAETPEELAPLRKSKYVQSRTGDTFSRTRALLEGGRPVLYSGTPCQIAGLRAYLGREYPTLFCVDVACHGVPGEEDFRRCIEALEATLGGRVTRVDFRDKSWGGWQHGVTVTYERDGKTRQKAFAPYQVPYYYYFLYSRNIRESCTACPYANLERMGDLTLADFWGVEQIFPDLPADRGVSAVLCNTPKGVELWETVCADFVARTLPDAGVLAQYNQPFREPCPLYPGRKALLREVLDKGYLRAKSHISPGERVKGMAKAALSAGLKRRIRRLLRRN